MNLYHLSVIENREYIKKHGIDLDREKEEDKWCCPECREMICCHNGRCLNCKLEKLRQNKKYHWGEE